MKKLWFFDLDGTLADTDRDIREAWKATLADLGLECPGFDAGFVAGPPIEDMAKTLFPEIYTDHGWFSVVNGTTELNTFPGQQVSLFNVTARKVEGEGFVWQPYTYKELWQGTLNEAKGDRILLKTDGILVIFRTYLAKKI